MPTYTTNYNLIKPLGTDLYDISILNSNMDIIDDTIKEIDESHIRHVTGTLSTAGWYRVGTINTANVGAVDNTNNVSIARIAIGGGYSERNPVPFIVDAYHHYGNQAALYQQPSVANPTQVSQIRLYPIDNNTCGLDVYYLQNNSNRVNVSVMMHLGSFTPAKFENVSDLSETARAKITLTAEGNIGNNIEYSKTDLIAGVSELKTGTVYLLYE